ncbi:MAG: hypothetical protein EA379_06155 [Phycisphaerales bacterium]|nr:MAG: hypothetical protein EA379_06155 [Phycisphaerales bacterium]
MSESRNDPDRTAANSEVLKGTRPDIDERLLRDILDAKLQNESDASEQRPDADDQPRVLVRPRGAPASPTRSRID